MASSASRETTYPGNQQMYPMGAGASGGYGLPGANPGLISALTQPAYLQGIAQYNPATVRYDPAKFASAAYDPAAVSQLDPSLLASLSPNATIAQLQASMVPQTQQAFSQLQQQLADFGVQGGQGIQAGQQLSGQLAGSIAPAMAAAIQNAQSNQLNAGQFDVNALNNMAQFNAANQLGLSEFNAGGRNQFDLTQRENALQAALANQAATNQAGQFNASNANAMNQYNVGVQNQEQQALLDAILGNYNAQMQMFGGLNQGLQQGLTNQGIQYGGQVTQNPGLFNTLIGAAGAAAPFFSGSGMFGGGGGSSPQMAYGYYGSTENTSPGGYA